MKEFKTYKPSLEAIRESQKRLDAISDQGTDEEYYADLIKTYNKFSDLRRRANYCGLREDHSEPGN